jgi:hypothetical protein
MPNNSEAIGVLLESCPGIAPEWEEHLAWWGCEERGYYNDISVIAHYLVNCVRIGQTDFFPGVFELVEHYITAGDEDTRNLMIVGLLEGIQNVASWETSGYVVFEQWLGPRSQMAWRQLEQLWEGKSSLMDVIRDERPNRKP